MREKDLHPTMCLSEKRKYKMRKVKIDPRDREEINTHKFIKSYFGQRLIK